MVHLSHDLDVKLGQSMLHEIEHTLDFKVSEHFQSNQVEGNVWFTFMFMSNDIWILIIFKFILKFVLTPVEKAVQT